MHVLVAEDNDTTRAALESELTGWGYDVTSVGNGDDAWRLLAETNAPELALLDWELPGLTGLEVCRRTCALGRLKRTHILFLTGRTGTEDVVAALSAGADDYLTKPFDLRELNARIDVGRRLIEAERAAAQRLKELEAALARVKQLQGLLPICMYCKRIRDDQNYWQQLEAYISHHSGAEFSHGICPDCFEAHVKPELNAILPKSD